ncbi:MAG TPA: hypothetical protein PK359_06095, partial [Burkholderiaceae bacterium]|nr:hypothetical protein [Burkholderiaceae bacterium]
MGGQAAAGTPLCRSRSGGADRGRWSGRSVDRGPPRPARRGCADHRPRGPGRRQLAPALSLAHAAQRSACEPPAVHAVPDHLASAHSEGQAGTAPEEPGDEPR